MGKLPVKGKVAKIVLEPKPEDAVKMTALGDALRVAEEAVIEGYQARAVFGGNFPLYVVDKKDETKKTILLFVGPGGTPAYQVGLKTGIVYRG